MASTSVTPRRDSEQPADDFETFDTVSLCDKIADDRLALRAIDLAVRGLQDLGAEERDLAAVTDMIRRLEKRLEQREEKVAELQDLISSHLDELALRTPGREYWHRDAGLVDAWKQWQAAMRARLEAPDDVPAAEDQRLDRAVDEADARLEGLHARTPLGIAVKVRYLFQAMELSRDAEHALVYGEPITDEMLRDDRERFGWSVVQMAERLARPAAA